MENTVFATIKWSVEDIAGALSNANVEPTQENIKLFIQHGSRTLVERSVEEGWIIISDIISTMINDSILKQLVQKGKH